MKNKNSSKDKYINHDLIKSAIKEINGKNNNYDNSQNEENIDINDKNFLEVVENNLSLIKKNYLNKNESDLKISKIKVLLKSIKI